MEIRFAGVTKQFPPDIVALQDIFLSIDKGEFVYLWGPRDPQDDPSPACHPELVPTKRSTVGASIREDSLP